MFSLPITSSKATAIIHCVSLHYELPSTSASSSSLLFCPINLVPSAPLICWLLSRWHKYEDISITANSNDP